MIISHRQRFVMLLPWKTASQTAFIRLEHLNESPYSRFFSFNPNLNRVVHQHMTYADFMALPESRLGYRTGTFVRNPYDRVYSGFRQLQKDLREQPVATFPTDWVAHHVKKQLADNLEQLTAANFEFDRWWALVEDDQIFESARNTNFPLHPVHYWTHYAGKLAVDFVGKVEHFETDFRQFAQWIGAGEVSTANSNVVELEARSSLGAEGYRYVDRMSAASIEKVNRLFAEDFELFGYERVSTGA